MPSHRSSPAIAKSHSSPKVSHLRANFGFFDFLLHLPLLHQVAIAAAVDPLAENAAQLTEDTGPVLQNILIIQLRRRATNNSRAQDSTVHRRIATATVAGFLIRRGDNATNVST